MQRRTLLQGLAAVLAAPLLPACARDDRPPRLASTGGAGNIAAAGTQATAAGRGAIVPLDKPASEWKALLSPAAYAVLFEEDTERAGSSPLNAQKRPGTYICAACFLPLFDAAHKFESGTGWPSFTRPIDPRHVGTKRDFKLILPRTEYHCARCGGHQGHIFNDGPRPRGERWCNNGVALNFVPEGDALPALRS
ncbi:peptide-methionine (R)-S-oxide reductase MsrB [Luteimonas vadosa]|uniref:peptide-methionine (R)-S-oxide reductase n=1 Tax=Luteimonas vadosa TaxID=1165507 RepID=A0ABP9DRD9_9GAMM